MSWSDLLLTSPPAPLKEWANFDFNTIALRHGAAAGAVLVSDATGNAHWSAGGGFTGHCYAGLGSGDGDFDIGDGKFFLPLNLNPVTGGVWTLENPADTSDLKFTGTSGTVYQVSANVSVTTNVNTPVSVVAGIFRQVGGVGSYILQGTETEWASTTSGDTGTIGVGPVILSIGTGDKLAVFLDTTSSLATDVTIFAEPDGAANLTAVQIGQP
jgi:hypothetical protein